MGTLTIRRLDETTKALLKKRAARHGRSMEEEAREILAATVKPAGTKKGLGTAIGEIFKSTGGGELEPFPRSPLRLPPDFKDW